MSFRSCHRWAYARSLWGPQGAIIRPKMRKATPSLWGYWSALHMAIGLTPPTGSQAPGIRVPKVKTGFVVAGTWPRARYARQPKKKPPKRRLLTEGRIGASAAFVPRNDSEAPPLVTVRTNSEVSSAHLFPDLDLHFFIGVDPLPIRWKSTKTDQLDT